MNRVPTLDAIDARARDLLASATGADLQREPPEIRYLFSRKGFNPLFWILLTAMADPNLRYIFVYGGSSAAKTYTITQVLTWLAGRDKASSMILRKFSVDIEDSVWADFKEVNAKFKFEQVTTIIKRHIRYHNGAQHRFRGLDQSEKLKGLKGFKYLYYNELSLFDKKDFSQGRKRLRGMPGQKIIGDWNPISEQHWVKQDIIDNETWSTWNPDGQPWDGNSTAMPTYTVPNMTKQPKYRYLDPDSSWVKINASGNMLLIKTTYLDNYWVVGRPSGVGGFYDQHVVQDFEYDRVHNPNDYRIYALGEWGRMRTGGEFWKSFSEAAHVKPLSYQEGNSIHISLDNNVQPYVTCSLWQIDTQTKHISQFHEIAAKSPNNNAPRAARLLVDYLNRIGYKDVVFVYGDPSARARSTVDADGASFFDKYIGELRAAGFHVRDRVQRSAPEVAQSGNFINEIYANSYEGWSISISQTCRTSIDDYCNALEDKDGKVLKKRITDKATGLSYEQYGHFSDAKRYFITTILSAEFRKFKTRRHRLVVSS